MAKQVSLVIFPACGIRWPIAGRDGDTHSAEAVRHRIKELCDAELPGAILSDDDIADRLREEGVDIARRTVAKYREAINIPSSVKRRRIKSGRT